MGRPKNFFCWMSLRLDLRRYHAANFKVIRQLNRERGLTVFLVEQNAYHALKLAHRGYVMVNGQITLSGPAAELLRRDEIKAAYLEGGTHA